MLVSVFLSFAVGITAGWLFRRWFVKRETEHLEARRKEGAQLSIEIKELMDSNLALTNRVLQIRDELQEIAERERRSKPVDLNYWIN
jgi:hypothetical protein